MFSPLEIIYLLLLFAAFLAPLVPMRRRSVGIAHFPVVTVSLLILTVVCYFGSLHYGRLDGEVVRHWGMTPRDASLITLVTHMFLHGGLKHLFGNMLGLWLFGPHVEEALGRLEFFLFYIGCGIAAALLHLVVALTLMPGAADLPMVGASGAIFGILGLFAVRFWRARVRVLLLFEIPAVWAVGLWVAFQIIEGVVSLAGGGRSETVANWAHIGGFLFGALIALPLKMRQDSHREYSLEDAEAAIAEGDHDGAASHYRQALTASPDDPDAHYALAKCCVRLRQSEAAHRHFTEALRLYLRTRQSLAVARVYEDALSGFESFPLNATLLQRVASACEESEQFTLAIHALSELCRDYPNTREAEVGLLRLGKIHLHKMNQPQMAESIFAEFQQLYPESEWSLYAAKLREEARSAASHIGPLAAPGA
jgi:membrane associated rhomboid family serine protease